jgi:hypothetical protein
LLGPFDRIVRPLAGRTYNENRRIVELLPESRTPIVNWLNVLACVGVPLMTPVRAFRVSPAGRLPSSRLQIYPAPVPPDAASCVE